MAYLSNRRVIHRDLACRNLLVNESGRVVVSDFGMSRVGDVYSANNAKLPIKWTAPEVMSGGSSTTASDVWSFGVVCWEILNDGAPPFSWMSNVEVFEEIQSGTRLPKPKVVQEDLWKLIVRCWEDQPSKRPTFVQIIEALSLIKTSEDIYDTPIVVDEGFYAFTPEKAHQPNRSTDDHPEKI
eukprot:TRINITY_DN18297_c0_g1_i1.p1 TRINITY_DN18297_c0_g1~~TRINITY_DN18297_c0_g1_i1.p1  ORF type:complete len:207 (+),score=55.17 TRINITY_DN18297_c0_g1_i1:74-622(+)